jgi:phosphoribosyl-AMP cyclohydrolase / phosphoribosyl-ATP pyrophosphohydrolase
MIKSKKNITPRFSFKENGLIPVVVQDDRTNEVLMMAYMNSQALERTIRTGQAHFFSRSRKAIWHKGATSGHTQRVKEIRVDCDRDTLLLRVEPDGPACHTGAPSCFYRRLDKGRLVKLSPTTRFADILNQIYAVIVDRKQRPVKGSYVASLFKGGSDVILKKIGEESGELIISSKNRKKSAIIWEVADLWFHTLVMMGYHGITPQDIYKELNRRFGRRRKSK